MNTQRWLALIVVGGLIAAIATRPLWQEALRGQTEEEAAGDTAEATPTPIPFVTPTPSTDEMTEAEPTPLPLVAELESTGEVMTEPEAGSDDAMLVETGGPFILARGDFVTIDAIHGGEGSATIYQAPDGTMFLRLEPFGVTDAPDLRVALSSHSAPRTQNDLATSGGFLELGKLTSNKGAQNYDIPLNVRLEQFESVVIYEKQFNIIFTTAALER